MMAKREQCRCCRCHCDPEFALVVGVGAALGKLVFEPLIARALGVSKRRKRRHKRRSQGRVG